MRIIKPSFGGIFENLVIAEMRKKRLNRGLREDMYFLRDKNGKEIDLFSEKVGTRRIPAGGSEVDLPRGGCLEVTGVVDDGCPRSEVVQLD